MKTIISQEGNRGKSIFNKDYNILDNNKNVDYIIDGKHFSLTDDTTIEIIDSSDIPIEDAIFYTIIEKSISSSKTKSSSSNSGKSNKNNNDGNEDTFKIEIKQL